VQVGELNGSELGDRIPVFAAPPEQDRPDGGVGGAVGLPVGVAARTEEEALALVNELKESGATTA
jgi:hypothetical protein